MKKLTKRQAEPQRNVRPDGHAVRRLVRFFVACLLIVGSCVANDKPAEPTNSIGQTKYRLADNRVVVNSARLVGSGIRRFESKRLILYTDIENQQLAAQLPKLADALFDHLTKYFGPLPPAKNGGEFQATGYLMKDQKTFRSLGLLTDRVPQFENGRHMRYEFWANDQPYDYYKRHLVLHEFTHTFMTCVTGMRNTAPVWYMEGMAEYFAAHRLTKAGVEFGVMPENLKDYQGFRRIRTLRESIAAGPPKSMAAVMQSSPEGQAVYSWGWAACWFFANDPEYATRFRKIKSHPSPAEFSRQMSATAGDQELLEVRWHEFVNQIREGYAVTLASIPATNSNPLAVGEKKTVQIKANRGWQPTGILLDQDATYEIKVDGRYQVNDEPKPWISEPNGVSIQYVRGERLGCVLGAVMNLKDRKSLSRVTRIGESSTFAGSDGTLYLRINDSMDSLANNAGTAAVTISRSK